MWSSWSEVYFHSTQNFVRFHQTVHEVQLSTFFYVFCYEKLIYIFLTVFFVKITVLNNIYFKVNFWNLIPLLSIFPSLLQRSIIYLNFEN